MILGVENTVWAVVLVAVIFNVLVCLVLNAYTARVAYKRGYEAATTATEALALGRLLESSRERYIAGEEIAQMLEQHDEEGLKKHPNTRD